MARIIAIANQKGGVGKTTTAVNLSAGLAYLGKRVLLIDSDPQGNLTSGLGVNHEDVQYDLYDVLINDVSLKETIVPSSREGLDIVPASIQLAGAEIELTNQPKREKRLLEALERAELDYDYIYIDCPPSLGHLTINAFTAAEAVLIPVQAEYFALEGLSQLINTIQMVRKYYNANLLLEGVLLTMYDSRTNLGNDVRNEVEKFFKEKVYKTIIARNVRLSEAPSHGLSIIDYDLQSKGGQLYLALAKEVVAHEESKE
ncbi:ParA family protein [Atopobacter phocae]|uniref:ParA family protein n=1 Tax=Atopobacter phocae TaxID=136492 RepID=UPI00046FEEE0|nr:AAA family ATPase [Atopobacter phocae]